MTGWTSQPIDAVCMPTEQRDPRERATGEFRYVDIAGIDRVQKRIAEFHTILGADAPSRARKVIRRDDVLVSTVRPGLNAVAMVPDELHEEIASTGFCVLRANRQVVDPRYLFYRAISADFVRELTSRVRGASYPAVSDGEVKNVEIPVPALSEQRRIVEILDQAANIRDLHTKVAVKIHDFLPALFKRFLGSPAAWVSDPRCRPLHEVSDLVGGATPQKQYPLYWEGDIPWFTPKDVKQDFLFDSQDHLSNAALEETNLTLFDASAPVIVVRGMILARDIPVALTLRRFTINQDMKVLVPKTEAVSGAFLWALLVLAKPRLQSLVRVAGHGTRKLDMSDLRCISVPVPDADTRKAIESAIQRQQRFQVQLSEGRCSLENLYRSLVSRAFDGSLTASWRRAHMRELLQEMAGQMRRLDESRTLS